MSTQKSQSGASQTRNTPSLFWEAILNRIGPALRFLIGQSVRGPHDTEEVLAEVYLGVAKTVHAGRQIESPDHARNLLFLMARQRLANHFRRRGRAPAVELGDGAAEVIDVSTVEENDRWQQYNGEDVQKALTQLPPEQREVLLLKYYQGMTGPQIADVYQVSVNKAFAALYRAQAALKKLLEGRHGSRSGEARGPQPRRVRASEGS
jgi:RNA polymerase sigma-70 factor (ECF subfamily)